MIHKRECLVLSAQAAQLQLVSRDRDELTERLRLVETESAVRNDQLNESQATLLELEHLVRSSLISSIVVVITNLV